MNKTILVILVIAIVALAFSSGMFYQTYKDSLSLSKVANARIFLENLNKKALLVSAKGKVTKISNRTLTVQNGQDSIDVMVSQDAKILALDEKTGKALLLDMSFIKTGDYVTMVIKPAESNDFKKQQLFNSAWVEINSSTQTQK